MFRDSIQFILCVLIIRTVLTLQGRIDLARICSLSSLAGCVFDSSFPQSSHCAHGAAWLSATGAIVSIFVFIVGLHLLPSPSARGGVAMSSSLRLLLLFIRSSVFSFSFLNSERKKKEEACPRSLRSFPPSVVSIWVLNRYFVPCSFIK